MDVRHEVSDRGNFSLREWESESVKSESKKLSESEREREKQRWRERRSPSFLIWVGDVSYEVLSLFSSSPFWMVITITVRKGSTLSLSLFLSPLSHHSPFSLSFPSFLLFPILLNIYINVLSHSHSGIERHDIHSIAVELSFPLSLSLSPPLKVSQLSVSLNLLDSKIVDHGAETFPSVFLRIFWRKRKRGRERKEEERERVCQSLTCNVAANSEICFSVTGHDD